MRKLLVTLIVALLSVINATAQNQTVNGRVTDEGKVPLQGVSVSSTDGKYGTSTDKDGNFTLSLPSSVKILQFTSVNLETFEMTVKGNFLNATMISSEKKLEEVVVMGYQTIKRKEITSAITTIAGKEIAQKPIVNFTQLLQGKSAGLQITGEGGRPGANGIIRIRGVGSLNASSEPLIILDGVQVSSVAYNMINPNDIEDVTILKDAAASAVYGSRAANGVLVVSTKKGKGTPELRYSFQHGRSNALDLKNLRLMNSAEKLQYEYEGNFTNPNLATLITGKITAGTLPAGSTLFTINDGTRQQLWSELSALGAGDWSKFYLREATTQVHEISLSGAADKMRYFFSLNKSDNEGVMFGSFFNKLGGRLNVDYQAMDWFKIGTNLSVSTSKESLQRELNNTQNSYAALFRTNPYEPVYNRNGTYNLTQQGFSPLEGSVNNPNELSRLTSFASIFGEAKFFKYLTLKTLVGINYNTLSQETYLKPGSNLALILGFNQKTDNGNREFAYVVTNTANWQQKLGSSKHSINILAGQEFNKNTFYSYLATARNFPSASLTTLENAGTPTAATTSRADFALISYFGTLSYDYNKKYYLFTSARRDGSSRFGKNNQFANFWAVGLAWDILKEKFINKPDFINNLRLKGSVGTAGNNNIGNYDALGTYALNVRYNDLPAASPNRLPNADLTWEINKNYDVGLEYSLLKNRISGSIDYFKRVTKDLLYPINVSQTTGFASYNGNIGNLENKGIELGITGELIRKKDLNWSISFNYTNVNNKITALYSDDVPNGLGRLKIGEPINTFFLVRAAGVNAATGKAQYYKKDGAITDIYSANDAVLLNGKSPIVKFYGSLSTNITFKGIDLSAQFYYSGGNYITNYQYQIGASNGQNINNVQFTDAFNYWKKAGDIAQFPNLKDATQKITYTTDQYLEKGDYISFRDLTVGYTLDQNLSKKLKMKGLRFYVQGTNLFISTDFRGLPEVGQANRENPGYAGQSILFAYPQARAITVGVDVKF